MPLAAVAECGGPWADGSGSAEKAATVSASGDAPHASHATAPDLLSLPQTAHTIRAHLVTAAVRRDRTRRCGVEGFSCWQQSRVTHDGQYRREEFRPVTLQRCVV